MSVWRSQLRARNIALSGQRFQIKSTLKKKNENMKRTVQANKIERKDCKKWR